MACLTTNRRRPTETAGEAAIEEVVEARRWVEAAAMSSGERATEAETTLAARGEAASVEAIESLVVTTATVTVEATTEIAEDREAIEVDEVRRWVGPVVVVVVVVATRRIARHPRLALQQPPSSPTIPLRSTAAVVVEGLRHRGAHHNHNHTAVEEDRHLEELHQQCRTRTAVVRLLHRVAMAARQHLAAMLHRRSSGHLRRTACTQAECRRSLARHRLRWATAVRHHQALAAAIPRRQACEAWERRQQSSTCHRQATAADNHHRSSSSTVADHHHRQVNITNHDSAPMLYSLPLVHTSQYIQLVIQSFSHFSHFIHRVGWLA